jgi:hypothetical protein
MCKFLKKLFSFLLVSIYVGVCDLWKHLHFINSKIMLEFFNISIIQGTNVYFNYKNKVYAIYKQLIVNVFGVYAKRYVEDSKGKSTKR